jgi:hypothetical protein
MPSCVPTNASRINGHEYCCAFRVFVGVSNKKIFQVVKMGEVSTFYLERVIGSIFLLIYTIRFVPDKEKDLYTKNLPLIAVVVSITAVIMITSSIPKPNAISAYLFFLMHALNIYKEYAKAGEDGYDHIWQVKYVFAVLLAIATAIYHFTASFTPPKNSPGKRLQYNVHDDDKDEKMVQASKSNTTIEEEES